MRRLLVLGLLAAFLVAGYLHFGNTPVNPRSAESASVEIPPGLAARAIAGKLREAGVLRSPLGFSVATVLRGDRHRLQAGTYTFSPRESGSQILGRLVRGDTLPAGSPVTFPEGFTLAQITARLAANGLGDEPAVRETAAADRFRNEFPFLASAPAGASLEGYLFPDTYRFQRGTSADDILRKMLRRFGEQWERARNEGLGSRGSVVGTTYADTRTQDPDTHAIVTLASIVEREVRTPEDRRLVAGILWKRFDAGIGLAADATIRYALGNWENPLTVQDLRVDSPYNTRRYRGLPPGPIGNPGLDSIRAALAPQESEYLYYLSASADGRTIFSRTLDEHHKAKAEFLR